MSSTEQAPEPTMDEILASIRKIISDDEPDQTAHAEADAGFDGSGDGLSDVMADAQAPAEEPDDILDLTQVVQAHAEPAVNQPAPGSPPSGDALQAAMAEAQNVSAPAPSPAPAAPTAMPSRTYEHASPAAHSAGDTDIAALLAEAGVEDTVSDPAPSHGVDPMPLPTQEESSITDALRAIDDESESMFGAPAEDASMAEDDGNDAVLADEPAVDNNARDALDDLVASLESEVNAGGQDEQPEAFGAAADVSGEATIAMPPPVEEPAEADHDEMDSVELETAEPKLPEPAIAAAPVDMPAEPEDVTFEADADDAETGDAASGTSFEKGIKDMLKPMLNKWLNDNMERIVHDAVKEEVAAGKLLGK